MSPIHNPIITLYNVQIMNNNYKQLLTTAINNKNATECLAITKAAFETEPKDDNLLAWIVGNLFEWKIPGSEQWIERFTFMFPGSLHPIQVYLSSILISLGKFDAASNEARIYLNRVYKNGLFHKTNAIANNPLLNEGAGRAFMQLTSVYTEVGARNYSKRALLYAAQFVSDYWKKTYQTEIQNLDRELQDHNNQATDAVWEEFFKSGKHLFQLIELCKKRDFSVLEKRVSLIEGKFRYHSNYVVDASEIFQVVVMGKDNTFGLLPL